MLRLNDKIFEFSHLYEGNEDILRELESYRNWIKHSTTVPKEEYEQKLIELNETMQKGINEPMKEKKTTTKLSNEGGDEYSGGGLELNNNINIINHQKTTKENIIENNENDKISKDTNKKFILSFNKKLKEIEQLSDKFDSFFNRHMKKIRLNISKKKENRKTDITQEKKLLQKDLQIKNDLSMIHNLTKENKKLKEQVESLNKLLFSSQDLSSFDQIFVKNEEIDKLKKKNIELNKKYEEAVSSKIMHEKKIKQLENIINKQKKK